jgi:DNA end-binding protein Ku
MVSMWKGSIRLALVMVPVRMINATEKSSKVSFNQLHSECHSRIQHKKWCPTCEGGKGKEITQDDIVRGYEHAKGSYVVIADSELEAIEADKSAVLDITSVTSNSIDPIYIDSTAYLVPEEGAQEAFETLRVGLGERYAIGAVVLRGKIAQVALHAEPTGFMVYRLRAKSQVREFSSIAPKVTVIPQAAHVGIAVQLFDQLPSFDHTEVTDPYAEAVHALITAKIMGTEPAVAPTIAKPAVSSFADSLAASLKAVKAQAPAPAPAPAPAKLPKTAKAVKAAIQQPKRKRAS